jgi:hypothetical protein
MFTKLAKIKRVLGFKEFSYKTVVVLHLKSGTKLKIPCDGFTYKTSGNELVSYNFTGLMVGALLTVMMSEVAAITQEEYSRFKRYC